MTTTKNKVFYWVTTWKPLLSGGELTFDKGEYKFSAGSLLGGGFFQTEGINKYLAGEK